ncbi:hypothetical protein GDO78_010319 [Eleutherodactylus coqui]|uniref:Secreted protein n=1 Tax=Eleutherodactylus coqui TaxID=57060 RepID=A0A8J6K6I6_ELECQ|nr:hypothetical protein GDO78_010319 [Eleutherodactylus coqui]
MPLCFVQSKQGFLLTLCVLERLAFLLRSCAHIGASLNKLACYCRMGQPCFAICQQGMCNIKLELNRKPIFIFYRSRMLNK